MMQTASVADNVSDVLVKIIYFTQLRRRVLHANLHQADDPGFLPQDLPVREFAEVLNTAVAEHLQHRRLLFRDTPSITFGPHNTMEVRPVADPHAQALLHTNPDEYLDLQISKLLENCLNRRVAEELLRQKGDAGLGLAHGDLGQLLAGDKPFGASPADRDTAH
jgi:flagellar basal body rod protein FlgB